MDTKVIGLRPENAADIPLEDAKKDYPWVGTRWTTPDDIICEVYRDVIEYDEWERAISWKDPETTCFYGSQDKINISTDLFEQNYELVETNTSIRIGNEPKNCKEKTEQEQKCENDYTKCTSYEEFFPYHGFKTDYSFGKCVPKTSFLDKLATEEGTESGVNKLYNGLQDIDTKRCDQSLECDEGMESLFIFNEDDMNNQYEYMKGLIDNSLHPAIKQNKMTAARDVANSMKNIPYSDACVK
ncbi:MAG: hypothetical protein ACO3UU_16295 [Minisyncoccia bacterium]